MFETSNASAEQILEHAELKRMKLLGESAQRTALEERLELEQIAAMTEVSAEIEAECREEMKQAKLRGWNI